MSPLKVLHLPVVVSLIGMNAEVLSHGCIGFVARTIDEWVSSLHMLLGYIEQRIAMGKIGRQIVLDKYAANVIASKLANVILNIYKTHR